MIVQRLLVHRNELKIVKRLKAFNLLWSRLFFGVIICQPSCDIGVQSVRNGIKEILQGYVSSSSL